MKFPFLHSDQEQSLVRIVPGRISHANVAAIATTGMAVYTELFNWEVVNGIKSKKEKYVLKH